MSDDIMEHDANAPAFDEAELANALAPLTAEPDDFRTGVDAKVTEASNRAASTTAPKWLRRAASIAPPGLTDLALAGPGGSAKSFSLITWLVLPWALLALGCFAFIGMLAATLRLTASGRDENAPLRSGPPGFRAWSCVVVFPIGLAVVSMLGHDSTGLFGAFLLGGLIVVLAIRSLSRAGLADRHRIGRHALGVLFVVLMLTALVVIGHRDATSSLTLVMLPIIAATTIVIGKLSKNGDLARVLLAATAMYAWISWNSVNLDPMSRDDLVAWCEKFDDGTENSRGWGVLGEARRALGEPAPDLTRAAEQLQAFAPQDDSAKWRIGTGAWRAGLATPELLARLELSAEFWNMLAEGTLLLYGQEAVGFAAARCLGKLDESSRQLAWQAVEHTMQHAVEFRSIRHALASVEAALALGDDTYAERHRDEIHAILAASAAPAGKERGGFGEWLGARHDNLFVKLDYTTAGVRLMSFVGAPSELNLYELDRYLTRHLSRASSKRQVALAMTRVHLRNFCDVSAKDAALLVFIKENLAFLVVTLFCGLSLWVVVRAPKPIAIEVGPITVDA